MILGGVPIRGYALSLPQLVFAFVALLLIWWFFQNRGKSN